MPLPRRLGLRDATLVTFSDGSLAHVFLSEDDRWRFPWRGLQAIDPAYIQALIAVEDSRFYWHPGVDPLALGRALISNLRSGRVISGASTITMQLARLMSPRPRTLRSKLIEALRAVQLELRLSKEEILAGYLRFTPFGRNVEGVAAAAWVYFGHPASSLTRDEILTLLAVPQAPARCYPAAKNRAALAHAREQLALRLGFIDAAARPAPARMRPLPRRMPHAARWLLLQQRPGSSRNIIHTSIDPGTQRLAERLLTRHRQQAVQRGINNAAVVVADHRTGQLKAMVGGFDWHDQEHGGQIPGFAVARSSGSLLKPLILSLAMDSGLALPGYLARDLPTRFGGFFPRNFDGRHAGLVRLDSALARSLNLPFVRLLDQVGVQDLLSRLRDVGFDHMRARGAMHYGLTAAVGGVEATLLEVTGLYAALARGGRNRPLSAMAKLPLAAERAAAMAPGTAFLVRQALGSKGRPGFPGRQALGGALFWKTGTSSKHIDAWALGGGPRHVVGVWFGNLSGKPAPDLVGAHQAGPLLFDVLEGLGEERRTASPAPPGLELITVCGYSGYPAGKACKQRTQVQAPAGFAGRRPCPFHMELLVDVRTGQAVTPACKGERQVETRAYLVWPADLRRWWTDRQRLPPLPPPFAPGCAPPPGLIAPPRILSPPRGRVLVSQASQPRERDRPASAPAGSNVPLLAWSPGSSRLRWHVDGHYLGTVDPEQPLYHSFAPGKHHVFVMDEAGQSASSQLLVVSSPTYATRH